MASSRRLLARALLDRSGVAALEMAGAAPVLLLILVACVDFGRLLSQNMELNHAVRAGAQYAITAPNSKALIEGAVRQALPSHLSAATVTATCYCGALPSGDTGLPPVAPSCDSACAVGSVRMMTIRAQHSFSPYNFAFNDTLRSRFGFNMVSGNVTLRQQ